MHMPPMSHDKRTWVQDQATTHQRRAFEEVENLSSLHYDMLDSLTELRNHLTLLALAKDKLEA